MTWTAGIERILDEIVKKHPNAEPPHGPTTEAFAPYSRADQTTVGDWGDAAPDSIAEAYNAEIDRLYAEYCNIRHIVGWIYRTDYNKGNDEWEDMISECRRVLDEWVIYDSWDVFCDKYDPEENND